MRAVCRFSPNFYTVLHPMGTGVAGKQLATVMKRAMVTKTREEGEEEGNGKGGKNDGAGKEDIDGKQQQ